MEKRMLAPAEIANAMLALSEKKGNIATDSGILLGIMAGIFIGFGSVGYILVTQSLGSIDPGLAKFAGAAVFPVGLMMVLIAGAELFTGNNLMTLGVATGRITMQQMFRNWGLVYLGNFIGSLLLVVAIYYGGTLGGETATTQAMAVAESKVSLSLLQSFLRGILCNIIVTLAVWMSIGAKDIVSKIFACWFPIMLFILCGFEHSIANMFYIPMGMVLGADITVAQFLGNLIPVTIGNIVGGAIIVPFVYYNAFLKDNVIEKSKA